MNTTSLVWAKAQQAVQQMYAAASSNNRTVLQQLLVQRKIYEDQMAWMTYISSALVAGRLPTLNRRNDGIMDELIDADLAKPVFVMVTVFREWRRTLKPPYVIEFRSAGTRAR